ncbi:MAG: hypothetical protein ACLFNW_02970 [Desulfobacterales bacterium]
MGRNKYSGQDMVQLIWGIALTLMGLAFFSRIPGIMEQVSEMGYLSSARVFLRLAFYLMVVILLSGGIKKIYRFMRIREKAD